MMDMSPRRMAGESAAEHMARQRAAYYGSLPDDLPNFGSGPFMVKGVLGEARGNSDDDVRAALARVAEKPAQRAPIFTDHGWVARAGQEPQGGGIIPMNAIAARSMDLMPELGYGNAPGSLRGGARFVGAPFPASKRAMDSSALWNAPEAQHPVGMQDIFNSGLSGPGALVQALMRLLYHESMSSNSIPQNRPGPKYSTGGTRGDGRIRVQ